MHFSLTFDEMAAELCDGLTEGQHSNAHLGLHQLLHALLRQSVQLVGEFFQLRRDKGEQGRKTDDERGE